MPNPQSQMMQRKVLFLCTGNSARSQIAEGIVNHLFGERWQAFSAGVRPTGFVHPNAIRVMDERGIDISHARSKAVDEFRDEAFDLVVTVCDAAAEECPVWLGKGQRVHLGFPDPAKAVGTAEEILLQFRQVRDALKRNLGELLRAYEQWR